LVIDNISVDKTNVKMSYTIILKHVLSKFTKFALNNRKFVTKLQDFVLKHILRHVIILQIGSLSSDDNKYKNCVNIISSSFVNPQIQTGF